VRRCRKAKCICHWTPLNHFCFKSFLLELFDFLPGSARLPYAAMGKALSVLGYLAMVGGLLGLIFSRRLLSPSPLVLAPQVAALSLMLWARFTFGRRSFHAAANPTEGGLVTTGPYRFIRHPIYTAVCLFVLPAVVAHWSVLSVVCGMLVLGAAFLRIFLEEKMLVVRYPEYRQYAARTPRMLPLIF